MMANIKFVNRRSAGNMRDVKHNNEYLPCAFALERHGVCVYISGSVSVNEICVIFADVYTYICDFFSNFFNKPIVLLLT